MHEWDFTTKIAVYGFALVIVILATTLLIFGDNTLSGEALHGDILHSNFVMPHVPGH